MGKGKKKMASKSFEVLKPNFDEYKDTFMSMSAPFKEMPEGDDKTDLRKALNAHLDLFIADYPEVVTETKVNLGRQALEALEV